ncbi:MAG: cisplatin damage response ATP-dependent DNA ligase, partial [Albidovulum sp.]
MKRFARLFAALDGTTATNAKVAALAEYFSEAPEPDRLWTVALLSGRRPKRSVTATELQIWAAEAAGIPLWLFEESYPVVGDLAETIALVLPEAAEVSDLSLSDWIARIRALTGRPVEERRDAITGAWAELRREERFLFNKLITGGFRMGVSQKLMTRALSQATGLEEAELAHRLMGNWTPDNVTFQSLIHANDPGADLSRPYPFCLAYPLEDASETLGDPADWLAEWKWDGIRGQLLIRGGAHHLWSRGEELITDRFPEFARAVDWLPDGTVIDGEILAWAEGAPLPFAELQKRIGRKTVPKKLLAEAPALMLAYDLLEDRGRDLRGEPLAKRRARLAALMEALPPDVPLRLSPEVGFTHWPELAARREGAAEARAEGLMLKRRASPYGVSRKRGDWWKWKVDPMTVDAVMVYAQAGHG